MDILGGIFISILLLIIIYPNFIFFKGLRKTGEKHYKHKLFYFLISIILPSCVIFLVAAISTSPALIEMSGLKTDMKDYTSRIIFGSLIFPPCILINIYTSKFYLGRISKNQNKDKNEIELIGKE
ncbi:hypothetical protein ASE21_02505 [Flavobacterium sp. Root901]|uniref:hypothetical protein n=1 Tax=Flavobacterium sp. Root901 TaxID=1736605 RepID=UPI000710D482|nr:hypothetical protein [Flavobacterium sp. Root901]KRD12799.1 hypothetical protein ASE21_02505 [Flavobacterium sp. Root901]